MEITNVKLSNYVGQIKEKDEVSVNDHMVNIDKDLQNLRIEVNKLIRYVRGFNYEDVNIGSDMLGTGASAPGNVTISSTNIVVKGFDGNVTMEQLYGVIEIPHSYEEGTALSPHLHWMPTTASASNVKWQLQYHISESETSVLATATTISVSSSTPGVAWQQIFATFPTIPALGMTIGRQISFRLFRDPTDLADTYPDDAALLTMGFHYRQNTLGSSLISSK